MFRIDVLLAADAADKTKRDKFVADLNAEEQRIVEASLLPDISMNFRENGDLVAVIRYMLQDIRQGGVVRPAYVSEVERNMKRLVLGRTP